MLVLFIQREINAVVDFTQRIFFVTAITELSHTPPSLITRFHRADVSAKLHQVERPEGAGLQPLSNYVRFFTSKLNC